MAHFTAPASMTRQIGLFKKTLSLAWHGQLAQRGLSLRGRSPEPVDVSCIRLPSYHFRRIAVIGLTEPLKSG